MSADEQLSEQSTPTEPQTEQSPAVTPPDPSPELDQGAAPTPDEQIQKLEQQQPRAVMPQNEVFSNLRQVEPPQKKAEPLTVRQRLTKWWQDLERSEGPDAVKLKRNRFILNIAVFAAATFLVSPVAKYIDNLK